MTNEVEVALIIGSTTIVSGLITTIGLIIIAKLNTAKTERDELRKEVNGRLTELLEVAKTKSRALGNLEGRAEQTQERNDELNAK